MTKQDYQRLADELRSKGITDERVLHAIATIPRHLFLREDLQLHATEDTSLPIDCQQTISQPYVVAKMTAAILAAEDHPKKVLEVGTGSGYQAAILSQVVNEVYTIERIETLYHQAQKVFEELSLNNIYTRHDDGSLGWPEYAPYDAILITAATPEVPSALLAQLAVGGKLVVPLGNASSQILTAITRYDDGFKQQALDPVIFVPPASGDSLVNSPTNMREY
jgi:protein-L-isoaspartate(D-aspartate) O-methyltransferase